MEMVCQCYVTWSTGLFVPLSVVCTLPNYTIVSTQLVPYMILGSPQSLHHTLELGLGSALGLGLVIAFMRCGAKTRGDPDLSKTTWSFGKTTQSAHCSITE